MEVETYHLASIVLGVLTLAVVAWYAWEAHRTADAGVRQAGISDRIAKSAASQSEAPNRPVVVLVTGRQLIGAPAIVEDGAAGFTLQNETLQLVNIGEGPALDVTAEMVNAGPNPGQLTTIKRVLAAYIRPGEYLETGCTRAELAQTAHLEASYKSVSMTSYRTVQIIVTLSDGRKTIQQTELSRVLPA